MSAIHIVVLTPPTPLTRTRPSDRVLGIERWLVLAYPDASGIVIPRGGFR